ncbi:MAG: hypothetical protein HQ559_10090 [Lentisphaerae bacterium]|nr:hypothetical protein [Lentisphaerota bacterium]
MRKLVMLLTAAFMATCFAAQGAILLVDDTWESGAEGWSAVDFATESAPAEATITDPDVVGGQNALGIAATTGGAPGDDLIFVNSGSMAGSKDYAGGVGMPAGLPVTAVMFDFYSDQAATTVSLYFRSDTQDAYWYYDYAITGTGWQTDYTAEFSYGGGWYSPDLGGGSAIEFATALGDVDQIGIQLTYQPNVSQLYGIDNFELHGGQIPEPGTYSMLGFAFLSLGVTFRRRLRDYWAQVKEQIKA